METRRMTSKKAAINEITKGKFIKKTGFESSYILTGLGRKLSRVRVLGLVVDKYVKEGSNYAAITLDDGTDTIRCKVFIITKIFDNVTKGDLIDVFGKLKEYNNEVYIMPEIISKADSNMETLRLLELEEAYKKHKESIEKIKQAPTRNANELKILFKDIIDPADIEAILESGCLDQVIPEKKIDTKDVILSIIKENEGIDYLSIIEKSGLDENTVDQTVQELLENKTCFEPSPGVIKVL
ncbi:MAG: OB-fold nucleic acid binding domain-containing protein [Candidatus Aenigmarchaeota archaeon]|nr:OB-fold nucleic acid binding domain-containing protein [Candidatus Aenigmarchaeota archaeon]